MLHRTLITELFLRNWKSFKIRKELVIFQKTLNEWSVDFKKTIPEITTF